MGGGIVFVGIFSIRASVITLTTRSHTYSQTISTPQRTPFAWPSYGQSAVASKAYGVLETHGETAPQATASTAKLISMLAVIRARTFDDKKGASIQFSAADRARYDAYVAGNGSTVAVYDGLTWTQYQAMQAVLLRSANNVADTLAIWAFGSLSEYQAYAQAMVRSFGMHDTTIGTDASGYSATTTSTAHDLAILAQHVLDEPVLCEIMSQTTATLPWVGQITNTGVYVGKNGVTGMKTGYIGDASGGVYVLSGQQTEDEYTNDIITVVMGAPGNSSREAQDAAYALYESARNNSTLVTVAEKGAVLGEYQLPWTHATLPAQVNETVKVFMWHGTSLEYRIDISAAETGVVPTGQLYARYGEQRVSSAVTTPEAVSSPPLWWRLQRAFSF